MRVRIPANEGVVSWQLRAPGRRRSADSTQVLQQVPEAGNGVPLGGMHQLSRRWRGWRWAAAAGGLVGCPAGLQQACSKLTATATVVAGRGWVADLT